jgi:hypothetical protein
VPEAFQPTTAVPGQLQWWTMMGAPR